MGDIIWVNITYIAEEEGKIVGFGDLTRDGLIFRLYTHKDFQAGGIGSMILKKLEEEAIGLGLKQVTTESSITAKPFFEAHGFTVVKPQEKEHSGVFFKVYLMKKQMEKSQ